MGMLLRLKMSFKMGRFSDTQHTHPGIFILESPPPPGASLIIPYIRLFPITLVCCINHVAACNVIHVYRFCINSSGLVLKTYMVDGEARGGKS